MTTLPNIFRHARLDRPRLSLRRAVSRLVALNTLWRERVDMSALDDRMLRDIGVTRAEVDAALRRSTEHLRLILLRGGH